MRHLIFTFFAILILSSSVKAQSINTLVDVGGYNMNFNIIKGKGIPILFEAGAGNDASVWGKLLLESIHKVTGTTLITYDRSGLGKSELNPNLVEDSKFGILNGVVELEKGLKALGFDNDIILVSHSYGGFLNALYSARHPKRVKHIILIDHSHVSFWTKELLKKEFPNEILKKNYVGNMAQYYLHKNYIETCRIMSKTPFPSNLPITNIFSESMFPDSPNRWRDIHREFGYKNPNVKNITAHGSGHEIFKDNPVLVINAIIKAYSETLNEGQKNEVLKRALNNTIELSVEMKKNENAYSHSEDDLNEWGYLLMRSGELEKALLVFKLNTILNPESSNTFDSYGEILMKLNRYKEAIQMYKKSVELNPENGNGKKMLSILKQK